MNATMSRNLIRLVAAPAAAPTAFTFTGNATQCQTPGNVQFITAGTADG